MTINGRRVYIKGSSGGVVVAAGVGLVVAAGGGAAGLAGSEAIGGGGAVSPSADVSVSVRTARCSKQKSDRTRARLSLRHADARAAGDASTTDCAAQTTGRVREYLLTHPFRSLQRGSFRVRPDGRTEIVTTAEAQPVTGRIESAVLDRLARDAGD